MFRRLVFALACVSIGCGTVENDSTDASTPTPDAPPGDDDGGLPVDGGGLPGDPDADPGAPLAIGDGSHDFQRVTIGASGQPFTTKVTNQSSEPIGPLTVALTGDAAAEFAISDDACHGRTLGAGTDCQLTVNFQPTQPGARSARLEVTGGGTTVTMNLAGIGLTLGALAITPGDGHGFGNVTIGQTSATHELTITNTGESPVARPTVTLLDRTAFSLDDNTCVSELAPLGTCTTTVSFKPTAGGPRSTSLVVSSGDNMAAAALSGTGTGRIIVRKNGDGASVSSVVGGGIDCGGTCEAVIGQGSVRLAASAPAGTEFTGWSIASCGTDALCDVPVDQATRTVDATFRNRYLLSVARSGAGTGRVTSASGIDCGGDCEELLFAQTNVTLQATADAGSTLVSWTGCTSTSGTTCTVTTGSQARTVTARFEPVQALTVTVTGTGTVSSNPAGVQCPGDCSEAFVQGTSVVLSAAAGTNQVLEAWSGGGCSGAATTCTVSMSATRAVTARFGPLYRLTVQPSVDGARITATPGPSSSNVVCTEPGGCDLVYAGRTTVTLTTRHDFPLSWEFVGWNGDCSGTGTCTVDVSRQRTVTSVWRPRQ
jgi:hypothetical protein